MVRTEGSVSTLRALRASWIAYAPWKPRSLTCPNSVRMVRTRSSMAASLPSWSSEAPASTVPSGLPTSLKRIPRGSSPFIAGDLSLADLYLAPIVFYVSLTPDKDKLFNVDGFADWWTKTQALQSYKDTQPNLG